MKYLVIIAILCTVAPCFGGKDDFNKKHALSAFNKRNHGNKDRTHNKKQLRRNADFIAKEAQAEKVNTTVNATTAIRVALYLNATVLNNNN